MAQGLMGCWNYVNYVNYSSLLLRRCISERNKVGYTLLYEATVLKYNQAILHKLEYYNCFIIQNIDNKSQFKNSQLTTQ